MVQSVELTLDAASDAAVRKQWRALAAAPSQGRRAVASNRPHVTLAALPAIDDAGCGAALAEVCAAGLPVDVRLGAVAVFGRDPFVLVRLVVVTPALLALQERVAAVVGTPPGTNLSPGGWTPHVTLARRVRGADLPAALAVLPAREVAARCVAVRRWDGDAKREWAVASAG